MLFRSLVGFDPPEPKDEEQANGEPKDEAEEAEIGPTLGPLRLFSASGRVVLRDAPWRAVGGRLLYERELDVVTVWGVPGRKATISNQRTGEQTSADKILWFREKDRVIVPGMSGTGVR